MIATRPFNWDASDAADEALYAANAGNPALFDADGNRKKLDPANSDHKDLIDEWFRLYAKHGGEVEDPNVPPEDPPDKPVKPCEDDELILVGLTEWIKDVKIVNGVPVVKKVEADDPMQDRRQYINGRLADFEDGDHSNYGRRLQVTAQVRWKSGKKSDLAGHSIHFRFEPFPGNRENLPAELQHSNLFESEDELSTDAKGFTSQAKFELSQYGGDRFRIRATLKTGGTGELVSGVFTAWRRVPFTVDTMDNADGTDRATHLLGQRVVTTFARNYVELVGPTRDDLHPIYKNVMHSDDDENYVFDNSLTKDPDGLGFVFADLVASNPEDEDANFPAAKYVVRKRWVPKVGFLAMPPYRRIASATWKHFSGKWATFPLDNISAMGHSNGFDVNIHFDLSGVKGLNPKRRVKVKLKIQVFQSLGGFQNHDGWLFVASRHYGGGHIEQNYVDSICIHEAGHAFGVAAENTPEGTKNGHVMDWAGHCSNGDKSCIMYKSSANASDFCYVCSDMLRARDLKSLPLEWDAPYSKSGET